MFRLLRDVFRLGRDMAPRIDRVQRIQVAPGDLLLFHVPEEAYNQEPFRNHVREAMGGALQHAGARALILPEAMKLTHVLKSPQRDGNTDDA